MSEQELRSLVKSQKRKIELQDKAIKHLRAEVEFSRPILFEVLVCCLYFSLQSTLH